MLKSRAFTLPLKALAAAAFASLSLGAQAQTEIQMWHSMTGALGDKVQEITTKFNASQSTAPVRTFRTIFCDHPFIPST